MVVLCLRVFMCVLCTHVYRPTGNDPLYNYLIIFNHLTISLKHCSYIISYIISHIISSSSLGFSDVSVITFVLTSVCNNNFNNSHSFFKILDRNL